MSVLPDPFLTDYTANLKIVEHHIGRTMYLRRAKRYESKLAGVLPYHKEVASKR
jgi:hypothetical protein